jgi:hypothetical protein
LRAAIVGWGNAVSSSTPRPRASVMHKLIWIRGEISRSLNVQAHGETEQSGGITVACVVGQSPASRVFLG